MHLCTNDFSFGPTANCRRFDFTVEFSSIFLVAVPALLFLLLSCPALYSLLRSPNNLKPLREWSKAPRVLLVGKTVAFIWLAVASIASLIFWSATSGINKWSAIFSQASNAFASCCLGVLILLSHFRDRRGSMLATLYLLASLLCDGSVIRTYYLTGLMHSGAGITACLIIVARLVVLAFDNAGKEGTLKRSDSGRPFSPDSTATSISRLLFFWLDPLLWRGFRQPLDMDALGELDPDLETALLYERAIVQWEKYSKAGTAHPLFWTIIVTFRKDLIKPVVPCILYTLAQISQPVIVHSVLEYLDSFTTDAPESDETGWGLAGAYFLVFLLYSVSFALYNLEVNRNMLMLRGFFVEAIYRKSLRVHLQVATEVGSGAATSLMSVDVTRVMTQMLSIHQLYSAAILVALGFVIVHRTIGIVWLATLVTAVACLTLLPLLARGTGTIQTVYSAATDKRIRLIASILAGIKQIKLSAYEEPLEAKVGVLRAEEQKLQQKYWTKLLIVSTLTNYLSNMLVVSTLTLYFILAKVGYLEFNLANVFATLSVVTIISWPMLMLGQNFAQMLAAHASLKRIEGFLLKPERPQPVEHTPSGQAAILQNVALAYGQDRVLENLNLAITSGHLTMIIGETGSGKSTLLNALLGEVDIIDGHATLPDAQKIANATQESWLQQDMSIRDNITFHDEYDPTWYRTVVAACALDRDFQLMDRGDKKKAQGLSGGQAQRIALARALYSRADIYILDDIFSALDATTEAHVFTTLFGHDGLLTGKTVVLATNGIHRLQYSDYIVTLEDKGIVEQGSWDALQRSGRYTQKLIEQFGSGTAKQAAKKKVAEDDLQLMRAGASQATSAPEDLIALEMAAKYWSGWPTWAFMKAAGLHLSGFSFFCYTLAFTLIGITSLYIQIWTVMGPLDYGYFAGFLVLEIAYLGAFWGAVSLMYLVWAFRGSRTLHKALVKSVLRAEVSFFERTPVGVILNRFSEDTNSVDQVYPNHLANTISFVVTTFTALVLIAIASYYTLPVVAVAIVTLVIAQRFYIRSSRELRKLSLASKSPLYSLFATTIDPAGLQIIRAFKAGAYLQDINTDHANISQAPTYLAYVVKRWLGIVLDLSVTALNTSLVLLAVAERRSKSAGVFAVALQQGISLTTTINALIISYSELEIEETSISRVKQFSHLPQEDGKFSGQETKTEENAARKTLELAQATKFASTAITFSKVTLRYNATESAALRTVTFTIPNGARVGFVGRTGSGKSTTLAALLRMNEIDDDGGSIAIGGQDIRQISRYQLRRQIANVPQDPLLLDMPLRDNLDLEGNHSDEAIWSALEACMAKSFVSALDGKLDFAVSGSSAFSRGQRQLLALCRTVLNPRPIICLDEATSSLDVLTDHAIQETIRACFKNATVLAVAHRIHTVIDYDLICVLDAGQVVEFGSPSELLLSEGAFYSLAKEQGLKM